MRVWKARKARALLPPLHFLLYWQSVALDERGAVRCELEVGLMSLEADGRGSLIPRAPGLATCLAVLGSFPEEVGLLVLVYPLYCYSGLAT